MTRNEKTVVCEPLQVFPGRIVVIVLFTFEFQLQLLATITNVTAGVVLVHGGHYPPACAVTAATTHDKEGEGVLLHPPTCVPTNVTSDGKGVLRLDAGVLLDHICSLQDQKRRRSLTLSPKVRRW